MSITRSGDNERGQRRLPTRRPSLTKPEGMCQFGLYRIPIDVPRPLLVWTRRHVPELLLPMRAPHLRVLEGGDELPCALSSTEVETRGNRPGEILERSQNGSDFLRHIHNRRITVSIELPRADVDRRHTVY